MQSVPTKLRILLIEGQRPIAKIIWEFLEAREQVMDHAADGQTGLQLALDNTYDVIVLNIDLPKLDGIEVAKRYRAQHGTAPILMLSARDRLEDKLLGFESGADDYLTKPFELRELEARIQVLHKRMRRRSPSILCVADLKLNIDSRVATRQGQRLSLSPSGRRLLEALLRNAPHVMRYAELARALWGDAEFNPAYLHSQVSVLRSAVDRPYKQPLILTVHGFGYRIAPPSAVPQPIATESTVVSHRCGFTTA
jgi:DNA-binding response OmpR family regulator